MTCSVGPVSAIVIDVIHPGVRATGASVLALFQNLFGLAAGPFIVGMLSDSLGLDERDDDDPGVRRPGRSCSSCSRRAAMRATSSVSPR